MNNFFWKKNFVRKKISQNVFWINWGSGEHEEKFLEGEKVSKTQIRSKEGEKVQNWCRRARRTVFFLIIFVFLAT